MAKMEELMKKLKDETFAKKFEGVKSAEDFVAAAKKEGYDITAEDMESVRDLSDEDMANVAGGDRAYLLRLFESPEAFKC